MNPMHRTFFFFKNQKAEVNEFQVCGSKWVHFHKLPNFLRNMWSIGGASAHFSTDDFSAGVRGVKVATSVCCYPEGKQNCLALNKVHWGSSSSPAELTKWARPPQRLCGRTQHHGSRPQLGGRAGRLPADNVQKLPGLAQLCINGGWSPHHLLCLLPNLVPPP